MSLCAAFVKEPSRIIEGIRDPYLLKAVFLGGAGGSGKSLVSDAMFGGSGLKIISANTFRDHRFRQIRFCVSVFCGETICIFAINAIIIIGNHIYSSSNPEE